MPPTKTDSQRLYLQCFGAVAPCTAAAAESLREDLGSLVSSSEQGRCIHTQHSVCTIHHPYTIHPLTGLSSEKVVAGKKGQIFDLSTARERRS